MAKLTEDQRAFEPRGGARQFWLCKDERILLEGPAGTGKTRAALEKVFFCAQKYPGMRALICRKTRASMTESVLVTFEEKVVPPKMKWVTNNQRKVRQAYQLPNGSTIVVGGMDDPVRIMSTEYDLIACFEATEFTITDFENLTTRLRNFVIPTYQQIVLDCNPERPTHWLNLKANQGELTRILSRHEDNPLLFDGKEWTRNGQAYMNTLRKLTGVRGIRLLQGKWAAAEGLVYEEFDASVHLKDAKEVFPASSNFKVPAHWRKFRSIDFGYNNPFSCGWYALDPDDNLYLYREIYKRHRIVEDHARNIKLWTGLEKIECSISDHDREDRETLHRHGIHTIAAKKDILNGIEAVKKRLRATKEGKGKKLFFLRDALVDRDGDDITIYSTNSMIEEFDAYGYRKGKDGKKDGKPVKEEPEDKDNHGMDQLRYVVAHVDGLGPGRVARFSASPVAAVATR